MTFGFILAAVALFDRRRL